MPVVKLRRMVTGRSDVDGWVDETLSAIERALNVTAAPPLALQVRPDGMAFAMTGGHFRLAKSGSSGIPAMSGSTPGSADVTLYKFDGTTLTTQTTTIKAHNMGASPVGNNKYLLIVMVGKYPFVVWEDCG